MTDLFFPKVVAVTVPPGDFRTPRVCVSVQCGPLVLWLTVRRLSGSKVDVTPPLAMNGRAGVEMPPPLWEAVSGVALAAAQTDADAVAALLSRGRRSRHAAPPGAEQRMPA